MNAVGVGTALAALPEKVLAFLSAVARLQAIFCSQELAVSLYMLSIGVATDRQYCFFTAEG
jgi:hypothetical protein